MIHQFILLLLFSYLFDNIILKISIILLKRM